MTSLGAEVTMVGVDGTLKSGEGDYEFVPIWKEPIVSKNRLMRKVLFARTLLSNMRTFASFIKNRPERVVLFGGYFEYLAPLWAWRFRRLRRQGCRFGTIVHDPVRDFRVGPEWWHRKSIASAYSFAEVGFVHGSTSVLTDATGLKLVSIPMGPFAFPDSQQTGKQLRDSLGVPDSAKVLLSFGHIRDGKNLDLLIAAIVQQPNLHLLVAGSAQSSGQKPASYYIELAKNLGISDRCHFQIRYIEDSEVAAFHEAADIIALMYSGDFRSASGALGTCIHYRKPCIASSGLGPLKDFVEKYSLGKWVPPDCAKSIEVGLLEMLRETPQADWAQFENDNSWELNAKLVLEALA